MGSTSQQNNQKQGHHFRDIVKHFNPAWFASVMGTAVIPLALSFIKTPIVRPVAAFFMVSSIVMFTIIFIPWLIRFFSDFEEVKKDFNHPIAGNFFPTMPISLIVLALDFLKYPDLLFPVHLSRSIALYLWIAGAIGIYLFGFIILTTIFKHRGIELSHANFGWYIPPVSKLIIPVAGFELVSHFPNLMELTFGLSIISLGVGFFLFIFVGAAVYHRYIYHELPMSRFASTFFIGIAPTAIIGVIVFKMMHLFAHTNALDISSEIFTPLAKLTLLVNWGFSLWWMVMAIIVTIYYIRQIELPYALSWWAFTFPLGAQCVATGIVKNMTKWSFAGFSYGLTLALMLFLWFLVFVRTIKGIASGTLFQPSH